MEQLHFHEFEGPNNGINVLAELCRSLPSLPSTLRYYDEFNDATRSISNPQEQQNFELVIGGRMMRLDFARIHPDCSIIFKHVFAFTLSQNLSIHTIFTYLSAMRHLTPVDLASLIAAGPTGISLAWKSLRGRDLPPGAYMTAKYVLHLLCAYHLYGWSSDYADFISTTLPLPVQDKYAGVRSGDVFLSAEEEALVVRYLDNVTERLSQTGAKQFPQNELADAGMLVCSYQFAMRPIQIAMLDVRHVRIWNDEASKYPAVHLTFHVAKQRGSKKNVAMTRRVKSEWTPIFVRWQAHLDEKGVTGTAKFFQAQSSHEIGTRISTLVRFVINSKDIGTATDLRHTAAQRLVDAGASHEELAEFLGHAQTDTGLVYFSTSASHAERINRALGASEVYRQVAKIAHDRFISIEELNRLKGEQQVAAVPHGIPISGIGGCQSGQPVCPYNPVTSCYGCRKFMPVHDRGLHANVLSNLREVVLFFDGSARGDTHSPAYMQLQRTIVEIQAVISELDEAAP